MGDTIVDRAVETWNASGKQVFDGLGHGVMHAVDSVAGMGIPGQLWNQRDAYRTEYEPGQRMGAQVGDVIGLVLPVGYGLSVARGGNVLGLTGRSGTVARTVLFGVLAGGAFASGRKVVEHAVDEGDASTPLTTLTALGGLMVGNRLTRSRVGSVTGALLGGGAGVAAGRATSDWFGDGRMGESHPERARASGTVAQVARAGWANFVEDGPPSIGVQSMASRWDRREDVRERYTDVEVAGAIAGSAAGLGLSGVTAYALGRSLVGAKSDWVTNSLPTRAAILTSLPAKMVGDLLNVGEIDEILDGDTIRKTRRIGKDALKRHTVGTVVHLSIIEHLTGKRPLPFSLTPRMAKVGTWGAAAGLLGYTVLQSESRGRNNPDSLLGGWQSAGVSAGASLAGTALVLRQAPALQQVKTTTKLPIAMITAAGLVGLTGLVRAPAEGLIADVREAVDRRRG